MHESPSFRQFRAVPSRPKVLHDCVNAFMKASSSRVLMKLSMDEDALHVTFMGPEGSSCTGCQQDLVDDREGVGRTVDAHECIVHAAWTAPKTDHRSCLSGEDAEGAGSPICENAPTAGASAGTPAMQDKGTCRTPGPRREG
jgi:hypothetical protein